MDMEQFPIHELLMADDMKYIIYNRGIGGFTTDNMLEHMDTQIFAVRPSKIFINIGTNDIGNPSVSFETALTHTIRNYTEILSQIQEKLPQTEVYLMAYYPVNETYKLPDGEKSNNHYFICNKEYKPLKANYEYTSTNF